MTYFDLYVAVKCGRDSKLEKPKNTYIEEDVKLVNE